MNAENQVNIEAAEAAVMDAGRSVTMCVLNQAAMAAENQEALIGIEYESESVKNDSIARMKTYYDTLFGDGRKGRGVNERI